MKEQGFLQLWNIYVLGILKYVYIYLVYLIFNIIKYNMLIYFLDKVNEV